MLDMVRCDLQSARVAVERPRATIAIRAAVGVSDDVAAEPLEALEDTAATEQQQLETGPSTNQPGEVEDLLRGGHRGLAVAVQTI